jgi:serine/threonine protein kinase
VRLHLPTLKDIKPENILVGLESLSVLDDVVKGETEEPSPRKVLDDRTIYLSRNNFGHPKKSPKKPMITDFDAATLGNVPHPLTHSIQPNPYRSPEVTLRAPWSYSADIWNLGIMVKLDNFITGNTQLTSMRGQMWDLLEGKALCDGFDPEYQEYTSRAHLGQLIALCGCPPKELLDRGELSSRWFDANGEPACSQGSCADHMFMCHKASSSFRTSFHKGSLSKIQLLTWKVKIKGFSLSLLAKCFSGSRKIGVRLKSCSRTLGFIGSLDCYSMGKCLVFLPLISKV